MKSQWHLLYFKGRNEKVAEILTRNKIENYFPLSKVVESWSVDNQVAGKPLFDSYIFARATEKQLSDIKKLPPIINMVYWLGKPAVVSENEIEVLKRFLTDHVNVKVEKIILGEAIVRKIGHPIIEAEEERSFKIIKRNIHILLPSLGFKITAEAETSRVRVISSDNLTKSRLSPYKIFNPAQIFNNF